MNEHDMDIPEEGLHTPGAAEGVASPEISGASHPEQADRLSEEGGAEASAEMSAALEEDAQKKKSLGREILEWILVILIAAGAALLIRTFVFEPVRVDGNSMQNTLQNNEYMIVTKYQYLYGDPERFDVVICRYPGRGNTNFVKRVVGIPGDTVAVRNGTLYVNGEAVDEPYIDYKPTYVMAETLVEEGYYFVMGDNRPNSNDSHVAGVGQLSRDQIVGEVRLVVWPLSSWRTIE